MTKDTDCKGDTSESKIDNDEEVEDDSIQDIEGPEPKTVSSSKTKILTLKEIKQHSPIFHVPQPFILYGYRTKGVDGGKMSFCQCTATAF
mmetsp:Transcript_27360/g.26420  ORF Transcript_27360/g.26420 Transcript_27360/m.26420 type:complete len:90 (-) Transcript_27360:587-856(-)